MCFYDRMKCTAFFFSLRMWWLFFAWIETNEISWFQLIISSNNNSHRIFWLNLTVLMHSMVCHIGNIQFIELGRLHENVYVSASSKMKWAIFSWLQLITHTHSFTMRRILESNWPSSIIQLKTFLLRQCLSFLHNHK